MFNKSSEKSEMSASVSEAAFLVQRVAEPRHCGDSVKAAIARAAHRLGFSFHRTRSLWYGHARRIDAAEMDRLRELAGKREARMAVESLVAMRERLTAIDPHFHQPTIAALDGALRAMGGQVGSVDVREDGS